MPSLKPSARRVLSKSTKGNGNAALNMLASTKSTLSSSSTPSRKFSTSLPASKPEIKITSPKRTPSLSASPASDPDGPGKAAAVVTPATPTPGKNVAAAHQISKSKSEIATSKIPMRATCEDTSDDHVNPNVYVSSPTGGKENSNPKPNTEAMYRDIPTSEVDMNPKSPKSPKTENNSLMAQSVPAKKKKKGKKKKKSKDIPPANIRSPTQEEKHARMVELYNLYDNPFQKQYERIKEIELIAYQAGMEADSKKTNKDIDYAANLTESQRQELDMYHMANLIGPFADRLAQSRARGTALDTKPVSDYLRAHSGIKVDERGATVQRAQDFWAEPNTILGREGKNLSINFKAALDRAAGGKINMMAVTSSTGNTNVLKTGTNLGGNENKHSSETSITQARPALEGSGAIIDELGEGLSDLTISKTAGKSPKKGKKTNVKAIKDRVALIISNAVVHSHNPEQLKLRLENAFPQPAFDDSWLTPKIIYRIFKHPKLLGKKPLYGTDINTCTEYIIKEIYPMFSMHDDSDASKIQIWVKWVNGCAALWGLIGQKCGDMNYGGQFGLWSLSGTICVMVPEAARPGNEDFQMLEDTMSSLTILTLWFVEEYSWAYGNFRVTLKSAEEVFPDDHSLIQAFGYTVGTKHLRFPSREKAIKTAIDSIPWLELGVDESVDDVPEDLDTLKANSMTDYGKSIPEVMKSLQPILDGFCEIEDDKEEQQYAVVATFLDGSTSLWNLIHLQVSKEERAAQKGLAAMEKAVWYAIGNKHMSMDERMNIVRHHTMWFITAWMKTRGDMKVIKQQALKELPNGEDDLMAFMEKDRQHVKAILHPDRATPPTLPIKPQDQTPMLKVATATLPATIPEALATLPKKAAKAPQTPDIPPPAPPHITPVRKSISQILSKIPKRPFFLPLKPVLSMLPKYGNDIPAVINSLNPIATKYTTTNPSAPGSNTIASEFSLCSLALWYLIYQKTHPADAGLSFMADAILVIITDHEMPSWQRNAIVLRCSAWFVAQWHHSKGDLQKVKIEALKELPKGVQDFERFLAFPPTFGAAQGGSGTSSVPHVKNVVEAKAVQVTRGSTVAASQEQKAVVMNVMAEPKFEVPEVKGKIEVEEQDDPDVGHENMEYIAPSSIINTSASSLNIVAGGVESAEVNGGGNNPPSVDKLSVVSSTSKSSPSPTDDKLDNMQHSTVPPTPPMTSEELSAHPDLHSIHNTLATLSSTLVAIYSALYGTSASTATSSVKANIDTSSSATDSEPKTDTELSTSTHEAGLILITACLSNWLKDAQSQIAAVDSKISALSTKIDNLQSDNKMAKNMIEELATMMKSGRGSKTIDEGDAGGENILQVLLEDVRDVKEVMETLSRVKDGELNGEVLIKWLEKAKDLQGLIEHSKEAGELREVLWPQGDGEVGIGEGGEDRAKVKGTGRRGGLSGELREKVVAARELYVKIGNQAGRGQGGGGFCAVM
ncbi:hypothetical protein BKA64DRAFT_683833 [Cadophora sp. MPI-SDFR-AT-0126]|nr:hypothetical protein BKA64DRAFT_683833 [Leotiomycetes sp. MPI-SDFR-AT-0126]